MANGVRPALGLSIGSTNLAAVTADNALTRKPVLTLYHQRPPEVGVPSENPRLNAPGVVITDFVDRVGDPAGVMAGDGTVHRAEMLIAEALRALAYAVTGGGALPDSVAVSYPAHWESATVDAVGGALSRVPEWSNRTRPLVLVPDAAAALFAARANPGIPGPATLNGTSNGTVAVCDFGGTGTSITLMDAAGDYRSLAPTVRYHDFSGNLIDQALLTAAMENLPATGTFDPATTLARGSLSRLRGECRTAKEHLSTSTVTTLADELPGLHGDFRLTRRELDEVIRESLERFVSVLQDTLARNGIGDLSAIVAVGGGANIPAITTTLSGRLRVPVITAPRPQLTPAVGAALRAASPPSDAASTMAGPAAAVPATAPAPHAEAGETAAAEALAWPRPGAPRPNALPVLPAPVRETAARPTAQPEEAALAEPSPKTRWYRRLPTLAAIGLALALVLAAGAAAFALHSTNRPSTAPPSPSATAQRPAPSNPSPSPQPSPESPSPTPEAPPSTPDTTPPATTEPPAATVPPAVPQAGPPVVAAPPAPALPRIPAIPQLPPIPGINEPIPGLERLNQILQEFGRIARQ